MHIVSRNGNIMATRGMQVRKNMASLYISCGTERIALRDINTDSHSLTS